MPKPRLRRKAGLRARIDKFYLKLRKFVHIPLYFVQIALGNVEEIRKAPAASKRALFIRAKSTQHILELSFPSREMVRQLCSDIYEKRGAWPLSFSYPAEIRSRTSESKNYCSPVFPGHRYAFKNQEDYLESYSGYEIALTHRKAGWDCFRHLEILYAGSVPFMPDAYLIPEFTMVHYPKDFLTELSAYALKSQVRVSAETKRELTKYFNQNLTSISMATYLLESAKLNTKGNILFVDAALSDMPDYQSVLTLIGLKQLLGRKIFVSHPVPYVYRDWEGDPSILYGRGFGYSRVLDIAEKNENEVLGSAHPLAFRDLRKFEAVIVGSITRNMSIAKSLLDSFPAKKTIWIHGEDESPAQSFIEEAHSLGITLFVRELQ